MAALGPDHLPRGVVAPQPGNTFDDLTDRLHIGHGGAEVPRLGDVGAVAEQPFGQQQVAAQRFQHVLPGPRRARAADVDHAGPRSWPERNLGSAGSPPSRRRRSHCRRARWPWRLRRRPGTRRAKPPRRFRCRPCWRCTDHVRRVPRSPGRATPIRGFRSTCRWSPRRPRAPRGSGERPPARGSCR